MWQGIFEGVYFCRLAIFFYFAGTNSGDQDRLAFLAHWELIFAISRKSQTNIIDKIFDFIEYVQWKYILSNNTTVYVPHVKPATEFC